MAVLKWIGIVLLMMFLTIFIMVLYASLIDREPVDSLNVPSVPQGDTVQSGYEPNWRLIMDGRKLFNDMIDNKQNYTAGLDDGQLKAYNELLAVYNEKTFLDDTELEELFYHCVAASSYDNQINYKIALKAFKDNKEEYKNDNN